MVVGIPKETKKDRVLPKCDLFLLKKMGRLRLKRKTLSVTYFK